MNVEVIAAALARHQRNPNGQHDGWWECTCTSQVVDPVPEYAPVQKFTPEHQAQVVANALTATHGGPVCDACRDGDCSCSCHEVPDAQHGPCRESGWTLDMMRQHRANPATPLG